MKIRIVFQFEMQEESKLRPRAFVCISSRKGVHNNYADTKMQTNKIPIRERMGLNLETTLLNDFNY